MSYTYYISSPLIGGNHYGSKQFVSPMKELNEQTILVENNEVNKNDSYRQKTKYDDKVDNYHSTYDLGCLIGNEESYLEGKLDSNHDADYYSFSYAQKSFYAKMGVSAELTIRLENIPEDCDYNLTVYDRYGNQIGMAKAVGNGCKELTLPDWDSFNNRYVIKVENGNGQQVNSEKAYRIKISETKSPTNTVGDTKAEENGLLYEEQVQKLHEEQYQALPDSDRYHGTDTLEELLEKMASGESLNKQETNYLKIFASLFDYEKADAAGKIKNVLYPQIQEELEKAGIDVADRGWSIEMDADGRISVSGELEEEEKKTVVKILEEQFANQLWDYYMQASDLAADDYNRINAYREINEFLGKATNGAYSWEDISVDENGKIRGLPAKMCGLLNSQECNGKYEQLREQIYLLNDYKNHSGAFQISDFRIKYQIQGSNMEIVPAGEQNAFHRDTFEASQLSKNREALMDKMKHTVVPSAISLSDARAEILKEVREEKGQYDYSDVVNSCGLSYAKAYSEIEQRYGDEQEQYYKADGTPLTKEEEIEWLDVQFEQEVEWQKACTRIAALRQIFLGNIPKVPTKEIEELEDSLYQAKDAYLKLYRENEQGGKLLTLQNNVFGSSQMYEILNSLGNLQERVK